MMEYLKIKAYEVKESGDERYSHVYFIPYSENGNVLKYFRRKNEDINYRYDWNYTTLIVNY